LDARCRNARVLDDRGHNPRDDIVAVVGEHAKRDVKFIDYAEGPPQATGHVAQIGPARGAWLPDPDGNILGLARGSGRQPPNGGRTTVKTAPRREPSNKSWP
jgi:hypothetical protein